MHDSGPPSNKPPLVSICAIAFNHEPFIRHALEGFVNQRANFEFEIVIHDDASTDATARIIDDFRRRYPHLVRVLRQEENQYKQRRSIVGLMLPALRGRYVAFCECDDYWSHPGKMARQVDVLNLNPSVDMCACQTELHTYGENGHSLVLSDQTAPGHYSLEDVLGKKGVRLRTASLMIRREAVEEYLKMADTREETDVEDRYLHFFGSRRNGLEYIGPTMAVYRYARPGSWSEQRKDANDKIVKNKEKVRSLMMLDEFTEYRDHVAIEASIIQAIGFVLGSIDIPYADRAGFLKETSNSLGLATRLRLWAKLYSSQLFAK